MFIFGGVAWCGQGLGYLCTFFAWAFRLRLNSTTQSCALPPGPKTRTPCLILGAVGVWVAGSTFLAVVVEACSGGHATSVPQRIHPSLFSFGPIFRLQYNHLLKNIIDDVTVATVIGVGGSGSRVYPGPGCTQARGFPGPEHRLLWFWVHPGPGHTRPLPKLTFPSGVTSFGSCGPQRFFFDGRRRS